MNAIHTGRGVLRIEKKLTVSPLASVLILVVSVVLALLIGAVLIEFNHFNPWDVYVSMFGGAFGSAYGLSETTVKAIPLMLSGLGVAMAFRVLIWNIGAEGQIYMGAFAAAGVALSCHHWPAFLLIPAMLLAGFAGGAIWSVIPGLLRAYIGVNEIITTLMFNYIAILWVSYLVFGPWRDPHGFNQPFSAKFSASAMLPTIPGSRVHLGVLIAIAAAVILHFVLLHTRWGYEIRVTGESNNSARYAGIDITRNIVLVMLISGGLAGLAGMSEVSGVLGRLEQTVSPGYGYTAIMVAVLARLNPLAVLAVSWLFGGLLVGGYTAQTIGVPAAIVSMLQGAILYFVLAGDFLARYRWRWERFERRED